MQYSRMCTACSLTVSRSIGGGVYPTYPWMQTPLDADPLLDTGGTCEQNNIQV